MGDYFHIVSQLPGDVVMDVRDGQCTSETPIIILRRNEPASANQLWKKEYVDAEQIYFYLVSKLGSNYKIGNKVNYSDS